MIPSLTYCLFETKSQKRPDESSSCKFTGTFTLSWWKINTLRNKDFKTYRTQGCRNRRHKSNKLFEVVISENPLYLPSWLPTHVFYSLRTQHHVKTLDLGCVLLLGRWCPTPVGIISKLVTQLYKKPPWGWQLLGGVICDKMGGSYGHGPRMPLFCYTMSSF